jgi:hypothetical protein
MPFSWMETYNNDPPLTLHQKESRLPLNLEKGKHSNVRVSKGTFASRISAVEGEPTIIHTSTIHIDLTTLQNHQFRFF